MSKRVSVLIPAYNEASTLAEVVEAVAGLDLSTEIVVVDDGSTDRTPQILAELSQRYPGDLLTLRHPANRGKGAALRTAIAACSGDTVVIQDADAEYDPANIPKLIAPILSGKADAVFGTRLRGGEPQRAHLFWHYLGNRCLSLLTNLLYNSTISDMEVGHKAFKGQLIRDLELQCDSFSIEPEITAKLLKRPGIRLYEIPVSYYGRTYAEGKKITWRDGFAAVWTLLRIRFRQ